MITSIFRDRAPGRPRFPLFFFVALVLFSGSTGTRAQVASGTVAGTVAGWKPAGRPGVVVRLRELATSTIFAQTTPDDTGGFVFRDVPFASYDVEVSGSEGTLAARRTEVRSAVPVDVRFDDLPNVTLPGVTVQASEDALPGGVGTTSSAAMHSEETIASLPAVTLNKTIESILLATPGVVPDEDGRLHVRGEDAQLQYVVDGIPITANLTRVYAPLFNAGVIKSMDVTTGGLNAEYGVATAAVNAVTTKSGFDRPFFVGARALAGSYDTKEGSLEIGGNSGGRTAWFFAGNLSSSGRYLDPVAEGDPIHDDGDAWSTFGKFNAILGAGTDLEVIGMVDRSEFQIPNGVVKDPPQDQVMVVDDYQAAARLTTELGTTSVLSGVLYTRRNRAGITSGGLSQISSPADSAKAVAENEHFFIGGKRSLISTGGQLEYSARAGWFDLPNEFRAGLGGEIFPVEEFLTFAVTNSDLSDTAVAGGDDRYLPYDITQGGTPFLVDQSKTGRRLSAFVQDELRTGAWTIGAGLRFDVFRLIETETALSPRVAAAWTTSAEWTLRMSYNRIVMQAPVENYLVSSSDEARELTADEQGNIPTVVRSEKAHVVEIGAAFRPSKVLDFDFSIYGKLIDDFIVKVELGTSGVIFPANLKHGYVAGTEIAARLREWNGFTGYLSTGVCISQGLVPEDGSTPFGAGLVLGEEGENYSNPWEGEDHFPTEHNQVVTAAFGLTWHARGGFFATAGGRFDFGLPFDLTGPNGEALTEEESREELLRRGYSESTIELLDLKPEKPGSPDRKVAPHATFDVSAGYDLSAALGVPVTLGVSVFNLFDTPYLYKFESTFGGTHYGAPRMVVGTIAVSY